MDALHKCLVCGEVPGMFHAGFERFRVHCDSCHANGPNCETPELALAEYNRDCAAIVSRVLAEVVKDAALCIAGGPDGAFMIDKFVLPGTYALIPLKEDK